MRFTPGLRAVLAVALAAVGLGLFLVGSSPGGMRARVDEANEPVNAGARDPLDITAHNSPTVAVDPRDDRMLAVANRVDSPRFSCALHVSSDRGATWRALEIPFPAGEEQPPRCFAPDVAFGADGTLHVSFVTLAGLGNVPNAAWVTSVAPGGGPFPAPVRVTGPRAFHLRLSSDPATPGRLWLSWVQASATGTLSFPTPGNPVVVARSDDAGTTWSDPVRVSPARQRVVAPSTAAGPAGEVYALYLDVGDDVLDYQGAHEGRGGPPYAGRWTLVAARSTDQGRTWQEVVVDPAVVPTERFVVFFPPSPSLAVGPAGRVYVAFHDGRAGDSDVLVWASADSGATFGPARRVNDTPPGDGSSQHLPKVSVSPAGRVDVVYYDRRSDPEGVLTEVSMQSSFDGAGTFTPRLVLSDSRFDSRVGFGSERGLPDLGSRLGLVSADRWALAAWADTRAGTEASGKQDVARVRVEFAAAPRAPALRPAGLALAAAGAVALAVSSSFRPRNWPSRGPIARSK